MSEPGNSSKLNPLLQRALGQVTNCRMILFAISLVAIQATAVGSVCSVDPDDAITASDESNNNCREGGINRKEAPAGLNDQWLAVSMWDNLARQYNHTSQQHTNVQPVSEIGGPVLHAINDIARHPNGTHYVFHRHYQSNTHRLGIFDPATGIDDIADTGISYHDSAFSSNGTLYAAGRDGILYSVDLDTGTPTALCDTGFGSSQSMHSALVWDSAQSELLQIVDGQIIAIDTKPFGDGPVLDCFPMEIVALDEGVGPAISAAVNENGNLYVSNMDGELFHIERDGSALELDQLPFVPHGLVADPGGLPNPPISCPIGAFTTFLGGVGKSVLVAMDKQDATTSFMADMPGDVRTLAYNRVDEKLYAVIAFPSRLLKIEPCSGEILSTVPLTPDSPSYSGFDFAPDGTAYLWNYDDDLYEVDLDTGVLAGLGGSGGFYDAMAISDGMAVFGVRRFVVLTTDLIFYDLETYDTNSTTLPLTFGPGQENGTHRELHSLTRDPHSPDLYGILWRANFRGNSDSPSLRSKLLVKIDPAGNVITVGVLPNSAATVALGVIPLLVDGFE